MTTRLASGSGVRGPPAPTVRGERLVALTVCGGLLTGGRQAPAGVEWSHDLRDEADCWLVRAGHGGEHIEAFIAGGFVSLGFRGLRLGDLRELDDEEIEARAAGARRGPEREWPRPTRCPTRPHRRGRRRARPHCAAISCSRLTNGAQEESRKLRCPGSETVCCWSSSNSRTMSSCGVTVTSVY
jgi:hypothetical protein